MFTVETERQVPFGVLCGRGVPQEAHSRHQAED